MQPLLHFQKTGQVVLSTTCYATNSDLVRVNKPLLRIGRSHFDTNVIFFGYDL